MKFSNIRGFIYGPFSTTFEVRRVNVLKTMDLERGSDVDSKLLTLEDEFESSQVSKEANIKNISYFTKSNNNHKKLFMTKFEY